MTAVACAGVVGERLLRQISELGHRQAGPDDQTAHRVTVDRVVEKDDQVCRAVAHDDVLAFTLDPEPHFHKRAYGASVINAGAIWRLNSHR